LIAEQERRHDRGGRSEGCVSRRGLLRGPTPALPGTGGAFSVPSPKPLALSLAAVREVSQEGDTRHISGVGSSGDDPGRGSPLSSGAKMKRVLLASGYATCDKCLETLLLP